MNKTKLEVIRINEDVIATSGAIPQLCSHINSHDNDVYGHMYVKSINNSTKDFTVNNYDPINGTSGGDSLGSSSYGSYSVNNDPTKFGNINSKGWYYFNGSSYIKCEEQSDISHPHEN